MFEVVIDHQPLVSMYNLTFKLNYVSCVPNVTMGLVKKTKTF